MLNRCRDEEIKLPFSEDEIKKRFERSRYSGGYIDFFNLYNDFKEVNQLRNDESNDSSTSLYNSV